MDVVYGLIPLMLFIGFMAVVVFIWMAKKGQFDDLDGAAHSIFLIDEDTPESNSHPRTESKQSKQPPAQEAKEKSQEK